MKILSTTILLLVICFPVITKAQHACSATRYQDEVFSSVHVTSNVVYGSSKTYTGSTQSLKMDVYEPQGDTAAMRPLIIWGHGGSFVGGSKLDNDVATLATRFAKRGYVCVCFDYRLGMFPIDQTHASQAVYRATQDAKAVTRYFRKDAGAANTYKIDAGYIFLAGSSAGAFIALHYAYLDQAGEIPSYLDTTGLGDIEGNSGNPGYCSDVSAIVDLCGALGSVNWMHAGDEPICSMHGTADLTVPYATATIIVLGIPVMPVDGSHTVDSMANVLGLDHTFHTWYGQDHVPYAPATGNGPAYMDSTVNFVRDFLCTQLSKPAVCPVAPSAVKEISADQQIRIYPTLTSSEIQIENNSPEKNLLLTVSDLSGRILVRSIINEHSFIFRKENLSPGIYFMNVTGNVINKTEKIVLE